MKINHHILTALLATMLLAITLSSVGQQEYYMKHLEKGKTFYEQVPPEYVQALKEFDLAKNYIAPNDTAKLSQIERWNDKTRNAISVLFANMQAAQGIAAKERDAALKQKEIADSLKNEAERSLALANKIIDAFYFYDDRFALAYKNNRYGFINKEGDPVIGYKYDEARPFDYTSLARVKRNNKFYLLDSTNTEYLLSDGINNVRKAKALDLSNLQLTEFPKVVFQPTRLNILLLNSNDIKSIPPTISALDQLILLNLSKNRIEYLPGEIAGLSTLKELLLYDNKLFNLPLGLDSLNQLKILDAGNNQIEKLPDNFGNIDSLRTLVLYDNLFTEFDKEILTISSLRKLDLSGNLITSLPEDINKLHGLTHIHLWNNKIEQLPPNFSRLLQLRELILGQNKIKQLDPAIYAMRNLRVLDLSYNRIENIPSGINRLGYLTHLFLNANRISKFPSEIAGLSKLEVLNLSLNQLTDIPNELESLTNLIQLDLSYNLIEEIPVIGKLRELRSLNLSYNRLRKLPADISGMQNLEDLNIRKNELSSLSADLIRLPALRFIDLRENKNLSLLDIGSALNRSLKDIIISANATDLSYLEGDDVLIVKIDSLNEMPSTRTLLTNLKLLDIKGSTGITAQQIKERYSTSKEQVIYTSLDFPALRNASQLTINLDMALLIVLDTAQAGTLRELDISSSQLESLPSEVYDLVKLTRLDASNNKLTSLLNDIGQLVNLRTLILDDNLLEELPEEIKKLTKLSTLYLRNNPIDEKNKVKISEWIPDCRVIYEDELDKLKNR